MIDIGKAQRVEMTKAEICDNDGGSIEDLEGFIVENIEVNHRAETIDAPIAVGKDYFVNKVEQPIEVKVTGYVQYDNYEKVLDKVTDMYLNREYEFYSVFTRSDQQYFNLCLQNLPIQETPDKYDFVYITLLFREVESSEMEEKTIAASASDAKTAQTGVR